MDVAPGSEHALSWHRCETHPSVAEGKVRAEVQPLGIGGKASPVRLLFRCPRTAGL